MSLVSLASRSALAATIVLATACSGNPQPAAPAPASAPAATGAPSATPAPPASPSAPAAAPAAPAAAGDIDMTGEWSWSVEIGGQAVSGMMTIARTAGSYSGHIAPEGMSPATVRSVAISGDRVTITVDTPDGGEAVVEGTLTSDRRTLNGTLSFSGQTGPFTGRKR